MIELRPDQLQALDASEQPVTVVDPRTGQTYRLIRQDVYERVCTIVGGGKGKVWDDEADNDLIRRQQ